MKKIKYLSLKTAVLFGCIIIVFTSCNRDLSADTEFATLGNTPDIYIDGFVGLGSDFYFPFVSDGAKPDVFSEDFDVAYLGGASLRIDVPNASDPSGTFAGASFIIDGAGRNLTEYDALTFWAKASQAATIADISFGKEYRAAINNVDFTTNWTQFIIPIPDPSKLVDVKNVFEFSAGGIGPQGQEVGYSFWIDELKFANLGTVAQPRPAIFNGVDEIKETFIGLEISLTGLTQTYNLGNGSNQTVSATPAYFKFKSSNPDIARVSELGIVSILDQGTATITATLADVRASGSLTVDVLGTFEFAPTPPERDPADVISIYSDFYGDRPGLQPVVFNNAELQIEVSDFGGEGIITYRNLGFVGIGYTETANLSEFSFLHLDVQVDQTIASGQVLNVQIQDFGPNGTGENLLQANDDTAGGYNVAGSLLTEGQWVGIDIPLNGFTLGTGGGGSGSPNLKNVGNIIFVGAGISDILVDNIYFYK
jgi:hypothetical protein